MTIFINYRVFDYRERFIGATGIGLTVDTVQRLMQDYQRRYRRIVYFVDGQGRIVLPGSGPDAAHIGEVEGLADQAERILKAGFGSFQYRRGGHNHLLNVRYVPELKWHLFVEKIEDEELEDIRNALVLNLSLCAAITMAVLLAIHLFISRQQRQARASREEALRFISHDLRSPLASIVTLAEGGGDTPCPALLDRAGDYAETALHLADGLVQLMRAEAADPARFAATDLAEAARDAADRLWASARAKGVDLRQDIVDEAPVLGDRAMLTRALANLLDNAIKFSPAGGVVTLAVRRDGDRWVTSVADRGPGIPADRLAQVFLPYQRGQAADSSVPGVGLGLALVKAVAEGHGGSAEAASGADGGAVFSLRLPALS